MRILGFGSYRWVGCSRGHAGRSGSLAWLRRWQCIAIGLLVFSKSVRAADITVTGQVLDEAGAVMLNASVQLFNGGHALMPIPDPVRPTGKFSISLKGLQDVSELRCQLSAPNYIGQTRNLVLVNGVANVGTVRLVKAPGLRLGRLHAAISGDQNYSILDLPVDNESSQAVDVVSASLTGTARRQTGCLDLRPDLIFKIADEFMLRHTSVTVDDPKAKYEQSFSSSGTLTVLGCNQARIELAIPASFRLEPREHTRLQFQLPVKMKQAEGKQTQSVTLRDWQILVLELTGSDGQRASASLE